MAIVLVKMDSEEIGDVRVRIDIRIVETQTATIRFRPLEARSKLEPLIGSWTPQVVEAIAEIEVVTSRDQVSQAEQRIWEVAQKLGLDQPTRKSYLRQILKLNNAQ